MSPLIQSCESQPLASCPAASQCWCWCVGVCYHSRCCLANQHHQPSDWACIVGVKECCKSAAGCCSRCTCEHDTVWLMKDEGDAQAFNTELCGTQCVGDARIRCRHQQHTQATSLNLHICLVARDRQQSQHVFCCQEGSTAGITLFKLFKWITLGQRRA